MTVPDFQSFMLPLLKFASDGNEHNQSEAAEALSRHFNITDVEVTSLKRMGRS
jgi:restriction system protein